MAAQLLFLLLPLLIVSSFAVCIADITIPTNVGPPSVAIPPSVRVVAGDLLSLIEKSPQASPATTVQTINLEDELRGAALGGLVQELNAKGKEGVAVAPSLSPENRNHVKKTIGSLTQIAGMITSPEDKSVALPPVNVDALLAAASARESESSDKEEAKVHASAGAALRISLGGGFLSSAIGLLVFSGWFV